MLVSSLKITIYQRFSPSLLLQNLGEIYGHVRKLNTRNNHEGYWLIGDFILQRIERSKSNLASQFTDVQLDNLLRTLHSSVAPDHDYICDQV